MAFQRLIDDLFQPAAEPLQPKTALQRLQAMGGLDKLMQHLRDSAPHLPERPCSSHFLESLLLYFLTLSLFSKLLLFTQSLTPLPPLLSEVLGVCLIGLLIVLKRQSLLLELRDSSLSREEEGSKVTVGREGEYSRV